MDLVRRSLDQDLQRWLEQGLITEAQADAIRRFEAPSRPATARKPEPRPAPPRPAPPRPPQRAGRQAWLEDMSRNAVVHKVVNPPFARRPPFFVNARWVGGAAVALAALGLFTALITFSTDLLLAPARLPHEGLGLVIQIVAAALGLTGGYLMVSRRRRGKRLVIASLVLDVIGNAVPDPRHLVHLDSLAQILLWLVLYYLVVISRYEKVTTGRDVATSG
jgi:hypothetical protein